MLSSVDFDGVIKDFAFSKSRKKTFCFWTVLNSEYLLVCLVVQFYVFFNCEFSMSSIIVFRDSSHSMLCIVTRESWLMTWNVCLIYKSSNANTSNINIHTYIITNNNIISRNNILRCSIEFTKTCLLITFSDVSRKWCNNSRRHHINRGSNCCPLASVGATSLCKMLPQKSTPKIER